MSTLLAIALAQCLFLLFALFRKRAIADDVAKPLRALLLLLTLVLIGRLIASSFRGGIGPGWGLIGDVILFFLGPILYAVTRGLLHLDTATARQRWLHLIPAMVHVGIATPLAFLHVEHRFSLFGTSGLYLLFFVIEVSACLHLGAYVVASLLTVRRYRHSWSERYITPLPAGFLRWFGWLGAALVLAWLVGLIAQVIRTPLAFVSYNVMWVGLLCYVFVLAYGILLDEHTLSIPKVKSKTTALPSAVHQHVEAYLKKHQPYLDPTLSLDKLAQLLGLPRAELSHLLNHHFGERFFDFVNRYRIEAFLQAREKDTSNSKTISEHAFAAGFNSRSAFNRAFRKKTGHTPSTYPRASDTKREAPAAVTS